MHLKINLLATCLLLAIFASTSNVSAQKTSGQKAPSPKVSGTTKTAASEAVKVVVYCDELFPKLKASLTDAANKSCATQRATCECVDRKSGLSLQSVVSINPVDAICKPLPIPKPAFVDMPLDGMKSSDAAAPVSRPAPLSPIIIQSTCIKSGTTLEVLMTGYDLARCDKDKFAISWDLDGKRIATGNRVECVCGNELRVAVNDLTNRVMSIQIINLNVCPGGN